MRSARATGMGQYVPGQVIVSFQPGVDAHAVASRDHLVVRAGLPDAATYLMSLPPGESVQEAVADLAADPAIHHAEPNLLLGYLEAHPATVPHFEAVGQPEPYLTQYALPLIHAPQAWLLSTGQGETVAVLDTGADLTHPMLAGKLVPGADFIDNAGTPSDVATHVDSDGDGIYDAAWGHGTHVAGIISLVAPQARIMPVKVLDSDGVGTVFSVAQGIYFAVDHGATVINMSLGMAGQSATIADAVHYAVVHNVVPVAAVADDGTLSAWESPASDPGAVSVTSTDASDLKAPFSDFGPLVDLSAPGVNIYSTFPDDSYATWSGTSMAAPFVSAEAALILARYPQWTSGQVVSRMLAAVQPLNTINPTYTNELGRGRIDLALALQPTSSTGMAGIHSRGD